jgi:hypothetical protein
MQANSRCTNDSGMAQRAIAHQALGTYRRQTRSRKQRRRTPTGTTRRATIDAAIRPYATGVISWLDDPGASPPTDRRLIAD